MILKISTTKSAELRKGVVGLGGDKKKHGDRVEPVGRDKIDDDKVGDNEIGKNQKISKSKKLFKSEKTIGSDFFIPGARLAFTKLRQAFVKALIFYYFDLERHIWMKIKVSGYAIDRVFTQLILDILGQ